MKAYLLVPIVYLAFVWQAALRADIACNGYAPNFLVLALVAVLWSLSDSKALLTATLLGLLSDCLAPDHLGSDMLCFLGVAVFVQVVCPPRLLRHPALVVVLVLLATGLVEFSSTIFRTALNHELAAATTVTYFRWGLNALGDGLYTALLAILPLLAISLWQSRVVDRTNQPVGNHWHRLTS